MTYKVTTAVAVEPLLLAEARLHIKADGTTEDALITAWITAARELAEHHTGCALAPQTLEMALDSFPDAIDLDMPPVASVTSLKYTDLAGVEQTVGAASYVLSLYGAARRITPAFGFVWPATQDTANAVRVRYVTGYAVAPKAVKAALQLMVAWFNEHRGSEMDPDDIQPPAAKALLGTVKLWGH